ncbi:hypothetical protein [Lysinibacillus sp. NPDC059133]
MYKSHWTIESFFRWIKQNLNVLAEEDKASSIFSM